MSKPGSAYCPMHVDEPIVPTAIDSETVDYLYTCPRTDGHGRPGTYSWPYVAPPAVSSTPDPMGLGLDLELPRAVSAASAENGGGFVEYGLVERAYALTNPEDWSGLLARYDHTHFYPEGANRAQLPYTASKYLARALGAIRRQGTLAYAQAPGTGRWKYNNPISHYAPAGTDDTAALASWAASGHAMNDYMPDQRPSG
jgi:hypothetical protein